MPSPHPFMYSSVEDMVVAPAIVKPQMKQLSEDEETHLFIKDYKEDLNKAIIRWWNEADITSRLAYIDAKNELDKLGDVGNLVLDIPYGLANYLRIEYGGGSWAIFDDRQFLRYLQKTVGQTFLSKI